MMMLRSTPSLVFFSVILVALLQPANAGNRIYFATSGRHCDEIIEDHTFSGDCCSLVVTEEGGCKLTVSDGSCGVFGSIWSLDLVSTFEQDCPPTDYSQLVLGMVTTDVPSVSPTAKPTLRPTRPPRAPSTGMPTTRAPSGQPVVTTTFDKLVTEAEDSIYIQKNVKRATGGNVLLGNIPSEDE